MDEHERMPGQEFCFQVKRCDKVSVFPYEFATLSYMNLSFHKPSLSCLASRTSAQAAQKGKIIAERFLASWFMLVFVVSYWYAQIGVSHERLLCSTEY